MVKRLQHPNGKVVTVRGTGVERALRSEGWTDAPERDRRPRERKAKDRTYYSDYAFRNY